MTHTLEKICAAKHEHVAKQKTIVPLSEILALTKKASPPRGFKHALEDTLRRRPFALIAEIKKASPSAGLIRAEFDPARLAAHYAQGGASCLSVITDTPYFQGSDDYLAQARKTVAIPVLRKDFMLDPYQIVESRALGADCVLLIMAALEDAQAKELEKAAFELDMDVLVEVHDEAECERALTHLASTLIGINNRNLKTLKVDLTTAERLAKLLPRNILGVCESGIRVHADLKRMKKSGLSCFLVGESLMRETDVAKATKKLLGMVA
jgi:indole-3-glycerol phosphate synthase